jgi:hypothetical protein
MERERGGMVVQAAMPDRGRLNGLEKGKGIWVAAPGFVIVKYEFPASRARSASRLTMRCS